LNKGIFLFVACVLFIGLIDNVSAHKDEVVGDKLMWIVKEPSKDKTKTVSFRLSSALIEELDLMKYD